MARKTKSTKQVPFTKWQVISFTVLRLSMGWIFLYAGIVKILDPQWTSAGYLQNAKTFTGFYQFLLDPALLPIVDFLNMWGLTLLGLSLLFGVFVRISSFLGIILMLLYYFPVLDGVKPNAHSLIMDDHIVYALVLFLFFTNRAGCAWGIGAVCLNHPLLKKMKWVRHWLS